MSISILPNQALAAFDSAPFTCNTRYFLPCMRNDVFTLQGFSTVLTGAVTMLNFGNFTLGAGFSTGSGGLSYAGNATVTSASSAGLGLQVNSLYLLYVQLNVTNPGNASATQGFNMTLNGNRISLPNNLSGAGGYNDSFTLLQYFCPTNITDDKIVVSTNYPGIQFTVNMALLPCSVPVVAAFDTDDNFISTLPTTYIKYFNAPVFDTAFLNAAPCRFELQFNMNPLNDGCYYLHINEGSGYVNNGHFNNADGWVSGTNWSIANSTACYTTANSNFNQELITNIEVLQGFTHTITFEVNGLDNHNPFIRGLKVAVQFNDGSAPLTQTYITNGLQSFGFTVPTGATGTAILTFAPDNRYTGITFPPPDVSADMCLWNIQTAGYGWRSNNISFRTRFDHLQTHVFTATNRDGAFNFDYSNGLTHTLRLWGKMKYKDYKQDVQQYNFSDNSNVIMSSYLEKKYEVVIGDAPEFVHDCLSMMLINDTFTIDGVAYIRDGSYTMKQRKSTALSPATFDVKAVVGISKNWNVV